MLAVHGLLLFLLVQSNQAYEGPTPTNRQTLVILDKASNVQTYKQSHSNFIKLVQDLGHQVDVKSADDASLKLSKYNEFLYDNMIMFCPQLDVFRGSVTVKDILEFIDSGRNLMLVGNHAPGSITSELASEIGFEFKES